MLHFLDRFNPIYPLKHTMKSHWISLNYNIQIMKIILVYLVLPQSETVDDTNYSRMFYNNLVYCIKSVNSFIKNF